MEMSGKAGAEVTVTAKADTEVTVMAKVAGAEVTVMAMVADVEKKRKVDGKADVHLLGWSLTRVLSTSRIKRGEVAKPST